MNERLTIHDLAEFLSNQTRLEISHAEKFMGAFSSYISQSIVKNKAVNILGFGKFKIVLVRERESIHIQTGERFIIPAHHKLSFVPDKFFKEQINRPFAFFSPIEAIEGHSLKKVTFKRDIVNKDEETISPDDKMTLPDIVDEKDDNKITENINEASAVTETTIVSDLPSISPFEKLPVVDESSIDSKKFIYNDYFEDEYDKLPEIQEPVVYTEDEFVETISVENEENNKSELVSEDSAIDSTADNNDENDEYIAKKDTIYVDGSLEGANYKNKENEEVDNNIGKANDKKKKTISLLLLFILLPFLVLTGSVIAKYAFLYYNYDKKTTPQQSYVIPEQGSNIEDITFLSTGEFPVPDIDSNIIAMEDGAVENSQQNNEIVISEEQNNSETRKDEKRTINWLAPSSDNSSNTGTRRADRPDMEIENRNRELARTAQTNRNQPSSGNATLTSPPVTNNAANTSVADNQEKIIPDRVRMTAGSTLMQIALEHYGDKIFWVYIYEYNKDRIKDFNNIPVGTEIRMPLPRTYGINAKSKSSVDKAREKQSQLYK